MGAFSQNVCDSQFSRGEVFQYGGEPCSESAKTHIKVTEK